MSLIITNRKTLKNVAVIILNNKSDNITEESNGDITVIKSNEDIVGVNIFNYEKYFKADEGAHNLSQEQKDFLIENIPNLEINDSYFTIGEIMEKNVHPKSERLLILKIKTTKDLQIVTNDTTVNVGDKVVVANVGATLPSGMNIVFSKVMGIESEGMLCGGETLGKEPTKGVLRVSGDNGSDFIL